jgi:catechol 2,3-dioxygenase-like lactoylglutathione lyase family enzyme
MPDMDIGHVHPRVSDLDRSVAFCRDVLGFELRGQLLIGVAFLADGDLAVLAARA